MNEKEFLKTKPKFKPKHEDWWLSFCTSDKSWTLDSELKGFYKNCYKCYGEYKYLPVAMADSDILNSVELGYRRRDLNLIKKLIK